MEVLELEGVFHVEALVGCRKLCSANSPRSARSDGCSGKGSRGGSTGDPAGLTDFNGHGNRATTALSAALDGWSDRGHTPLDILSRKVRLSGRSRPSSGGRRRRAAAARWFAARCCTAEQVIEFAVGLLDRSGRARG